MSATIVSVRDRTSRQLGERRQAPEVVTPEDVTDGVKLGRLLTRVLSDIAALRRRFAPRRITFRDIVSTGSDSDPQTVALTHRFGGKVEWWVVGVAGTGGAVTLPQISENAATAGDELVLDIYFPGTIAIRVEEAG